AASGPGNRPDRRYGIQPTARSIQAVERCLSKLPDVGPTPHLTRTWPDSSAKQYYFMRKLVLFDFDGTLADTAPDLAAAANKLRARKGLSPLPYELLRPLASHGARGLLKAGLDMDPDHPEYEAHRQQFLQEYEQDMTSLTVLFPG